jgi:hypothetical protein
MFIGDVSINDDVSNTLELDIPSSIRVGVE